ncbi:MAG: hypothetical protein B6242_10025 [Anaerolineaceae bacterium 4572_78]|nr:MAG: hypothetical protein B6242_10025 [Anaerolineaceae bacterium 4572_78]
MSTLQVSFELPLLLATQIGLDMDNISQEVKIGFALFLYEHKRISLSKACEIGGVSLWDFTDMNRQWAIPINYNTNDLYDDLMKLAHV